MSGGLFRSAKDIAFVAVMTALLIAAQIPFSAIAGIEIVTPLFAAWCHAAGIRRGVAVGVCFSLLRCIVAGVFPSVILLYLIYYPLFAVAFGALGKASRGFGAAGKLACAVALAALLTPCFTLIDDLLAPLIVGVRFLPYFYASLPVMGVQTVCSAVTVGVTFLPLRRVFLLTAGEATQKEKGGGFSSGEEDLQNLSKRK